MCALIAGGNRCPASSGVFISFMRRVSHRQPSPSSMAQVDSALWFSERGMGHGGTLTGTGDMVGMSGMDETVVAPAAAGLRVEWASEPTAPAPGQPVTLRYRVTDAASGRAITDLPLDHERPMHLILVSGDLGTFQHIHPQVVGDTYSVTTTLPAGAYTLDAEFQRDGRTVLDQRPLTVGNAAATGPASLAPDLGPKTVEGVTVALAAPQTVRAGQAATFYLRPDDGRAADDGPGPVPRGGRARRGRLGG